MGAAVKMIDDTYIDASLRPMARGDHDSLERQNVLAFVDYP